MNNLTCSNCYHSSCPNAGKEIKENKEIIGGFIWIHVCANHIKSK